MCLVLELKEPLLSGHLSLVVNDVYIYIYAARIVLFADLHVVQKALCLEVTGAYRGHVHEVQALVLAAKLLSDLHVQIEGTVDLFLKERILDIDVLKLCSECGMTAVVTPVCIEDTELSLIWIAAFSLEVLHHLTKVVCIHCKAHLPAIWSKLFLCQRCESLKHRHRRNLWLLQGCKLREVLLARLHCIDVIFLDSGNYLVSRVGREDYELRALDAHLCRRIDEAHAVYSRCRALVKLAWKVLHGDVFSS